MGRLLGSAARRVLLTVVGGVVLLAGVVMIVTPGPGLVGIAAGLAILAKEYDWAHRALIGVRRRSRRAYARARSRVQQHKQHGIPDPSMGGTRLREGPVDGSDAGLGRSPKMGTD